MFAFRYQILGGSDLFTIDSVSGELTTKSRVDRETVCGSGVEVCVIELDIMVDYAQQFDIFKIKVRLILYGFATILMWLHQGSVVCNF